MMASDGNTDSSSVCPLSTVHFPPSNVHRPISTVTRPPFNVRSPTSNAQCPRPVQSSSIVPICPDCQALLPPPTTKPDRARITGPSGAERGFDVQWKGRRGWKRVDVVEDLPDARRRAAERPCQSIVPLYRSSITTGSKASERLPSTARWWCNLQNIERGGKCGAG